ncbi:hypothetical protein ABZ749_01175 [Micromonospora sp. NPDC047753]|uniref:hypothetical protein n=1 Tax=Micromonospora sp. NPDC047753 TaxID=3154817 RepID=UPI0033F51C1A
MIDFDAVATVLTDAMPIIAAVVYPPLLITAGVALWYRSIPADAADDFNVADYATPAVATATVRHLRPIEAATEVVTFAAWDILPPAPSGQDAGAPMFAELTARRVLAELGQRAQRELTA